MQAIKLTTKLSVVVAGILVLMVLNSALGMLYSRSLASLMNSMVTENLSSIKAAEELEFALLEQRDFASYYILGKGNRTWLEQLQAKQAGFEQWLERAAQSADTAEEEQILAEITAAYQAYDAQRSQVIALYDQGRVDEAMALLLGDLQQRYQQVHYACEHFLAANERFVDKRMKEGDTTAGRITLLLSAATAVMIGLSLGVLWFFSRSILSPLRKQLEQIQELSAKTIEQERALRAEAEKELQTAHEMQMALMPKEPPQIQGFEITGRCIPANHVGGDLFQYFHQHDRLSISLADVTGHAMEAAIPVVMFSGILRSHIGMGGTVEELFGKLNQALHGTLSSHTLVCLAMGQLDLATRRLRFSNAGCPYPYHYHASTGEVTELQMDAYPLGVRSDTAYRGIEVQLEPGDRVVFCSDGIAEAANASGEMFGFERAAETVRRGCAEDLSAEGLLARIIQEVKAFSGEVPQGDDQTVVVLKVDDRRGT